MHFSHSSLFLAGVSVAECKVWRNPMSLIRGCEYNRFQRETKKEPLTYYDMNLSAQDHQTFFTCEGDAGKPDLESKCILLSVSLLQPLSASVTRLDATRLEVPSASRLSPLTCPPASLPPFLSLSLSHSLASDVNQVRNLSPTSDMCLSEEF